MQGSCQTSRAKDSYAQFMKMTTIDEHKNNLLLFSFTLLFFLGGFTSLVYQVAWQRLLTQVIGIDSYFVTLIVPFLWSAWGLADCWGLGSSIGARTPLSWCTSSEITIQPDERPAWLTQPMLWALDGGSTCRVRTGGHAGSQYDLPVGFSYGCADSLLALFTCQ